MASEPQPRPDLAYLRLLLAAATPGPWSDFCESSTWWIGQCDEEGAPIGRFVTDADNMTAPDMLLIVALRNAAPWLLDQAEAAERLTRGLRQYTALPAEDDRDWMCSQCDQVAETIEGIDHSPDCPVAALLAGEASDE